MLKNFITLNEERQVIVSEIIYSLALSQTEEDNDDLEVMNQRMKIESELAKREFEEEIRQSDIIFQ